MANPNIGDIMATTIRSRTKKVADNVTNNNGFLRKLEARGNIKTVSGGEQILQELTYAENSNAGWYSGYDLLPVGVSNVVTAAEYDWKQYAVPVIISGLEQLQNSGKERMIDLMETRLNVAETTMANDMSIGLYSDGTAAGQPHRLGARGHPLDRGLRRGAGRAGRGLSFRAEHARCPWWVGHAGRLSGDPVLARRLGGVLVLPVELRQLQRSLWLDRGRGSAVNVAVHLGMVGAVRRGDQRGLGPDCQVRGGAGRDASGYRTERNWMKAHH